MTPMDLEGKGLLASSCLQTRDLVVTARGGVELLRPVALDLKHGSIVGVMGASGAGKTTLVDTATKRARSCGRRWKRR